MSTRQQLQVEEEEEALTARRDIVAAIQRLRTEHLAALLPLAKAEVHAKAKLKRAHDAATAAHSSLGNAMAAHAGESNRFGRQLGLLERELHASASPAIDAFIAGMRALHDEVGALPLTLPGSTVRVWPVDPCADTKEQEAQIQALQDAQAARTDWLARIRASIPQAESLKQEALSSTELADRLDTLQRSTEEQGERSALKGDSGSDG